MTPSIDRLKTILLFVEQSHFPSLDKIIQKLTEEGHERCSERTIQRDLKAIRSHCLIDISFDRMRNGYFIEADSKKETAEWLAFFELFQTAKVINQTLLKSPENIDYIDFDRLKPIVSEQVLAGILQATVEKRSIAFDYRNFRKEELSRYHYQPYLLKQYQNRWYVFGTIDGKEFRTFGVDRISGLELGNEKFKPKAIQAKNYFDEVIGMIYSTSERQEVLLSYTPHQGHYIKTQPLHSSQRIIVDDEKECRISLQVRINYELEEQILKLGEKVKVIAPEELKQSIKERLLQAIEQY